MTLYQRFRMWRVRRFYDAELRYQNSWITFGERAKGAAVLVTAFFDSLGQPLETPLEKTRKKFNLPNFTP